MSTSPVPAPSLTLVGGDLSRPLTGALASPAGGGRRRAGVAWTRPGHRAGPWVVAALPVLLAVIGTVAAPASVVTVGFCCLVMCATVVRLVVRPRLPRRRS